ncbi:putative F420-dependent oxidoreductase [Spinactinospora alkalitolerans]|uniref:Putative F420-dependent oxidoreductase n=1 Tax=Spinactinospora alkalitolerans TaxID=687207 RepID=A0A852TSJ5_9ACTN|nr:LLM class flavin-dependent oxidoreductase [Spinactinospora alkalitolerans]NYE46989.1 putative F420-dependent oxidoreductase [Spinactinospora alkalitolerans]
MGFGVLFTQGVVSGDPHQVSREILEQASAADRLGFDAALTTEHKYSEEYFGSPLHLAYAIAARTERVRVGTSIAIGPLYNPVELAQDAAMLDQLSGGRLFLGLGAGYLEEDFSTVGIPFGERAQRLDEGVRVIREAWTKERFSFAGRHYAFDEVSVIPKPRQGPGTPIHLGAWTPGGLRRAARLGDGWISNALMSVDTMAQMASAYREEARRHGRPGRVTAVRFCWPALSREEGERDFGATALAMIRTLWEYGAIGDMPEVSSAADITLADAVRDRIVFGTPDECAETVERFRAKAGVDDFMLIFRHPTGPEQSKVLNAMELFASDVAGRFR